MSELDLNFEPADFAGLIWLVIGILAVAAAVRYVLDGSRPQSRPLRGMLAGTGAVLIASGLLAGWLRPSRTSHGWACVLLAALLLPWLRKSYHATTRPVSRPLRLFLLSLRVMAAGIALLMLARPVLVWSLSQQERSVLGILLDGSQSMDVRDVLPAGSPATASPTSRLDAMQKMLTASSDGLNRLSDKIDVQWMTFDARIRRTEQPVVQAKGTVTALGRSVDSARESLIQTGSRIAGLVVVSDGRDTSSGGTDPNQAGDDLAVAGIPLYCVGLGSELPVGQTRSLTGRRLDMVDRVTVLNRLAVGAEFLAAGLAGTEIDISLEYDGRPVETRKVKPAEVRELIRADLSHVPTEGGLHQVTVIATATGVEKPQGEARLSRYIRVTDDKVQVLYIDRARYERAAIARALEYAKDINLTKIDMNRPAHMPGADVLPATPRDWQLYHVVLIGDVSRDCWPEPALLAIAELVGRQGRGAAILGGVRTLGSGDYAGTPLDVIFPVDLRTKGHTDGSIPFTLTAAGKLHPSCQMTGDLKEIWTKLPPFAGASRLGDLEPTAEVLMRTASGEPLMAVQQKGAGRTAVLAFDSSWQWPFADESGLEANRRFWRQLVLWLANRKPEVWTLAERSQYDLGRLRSGDEQVLIRAGVNDPSSAGLVAQTTVTGELFGPDGRSVPLAFTAVNEGFEARPAVTEPGQYRVRVQGKAGEAPAGVAETAFVVESVDRELAEPFADLEMLKRMTARTASIGGEYVTAEEFGPLLERIRASSAEARITRVQRHYLVDDHPWLWLGLFAGTLTLEWVVRRRSGLV